MSQIDHYTNMQEGLAALCDSAERTLARRTPASLLLSGGSSPLEFYQALGARGLDATKITTALVDERWVDQHDAGSNAALVERHLRAFCATPPRFVGMKTDHATPHEAAAQVHMTYENLPPPALTILGMGPDAHTASWFAAAPEYDAVSDRKAEHLVGAVTAPKNDITGAHQMRMTITAAMLERTEHAILVIKGESRLALLCDCLAGDKAATPIGRAADILGPRLQIVALTGAVS